MNRNLLLLSIMFVCALFASEPQALKAQQEPAANGVRAQMVVTVEPHKGAEAPVVTKDDVMVHEGRDRDTVVDWVAAQGDHAALELFVLLDDSSSTSLGTQLNDIKKFISQQPASTLVGVAYMQNGIARIVQNLTADHALAVKALRLPLGNRGANASPYFSLQDLIKRWPTTTARRQVFMATDGIDPYYFSADFLDPYLDATIDDALRAGITVSAIYTPGIGHLGHSYWMSYWGQLYLAELADKTGGESYYIGFMGPPVAFAPYLEDFSSRLSHQYLLTFLAKPSKKSGLQPIKITTELHNVDLVAPRQVYVAAQSKE